MMIGNSESIKYKKHFLSSVICRIDFNEMLPAEVLNSIAKDSLIIKGFPIHGKDQVGKEKTINILGFANGKSVDSSVSQNETSYIIKELRNETGENKFVFAPSFFVFEYKKYESFEELKQYFMKVVNNIGEKGRDININRFGLRYINIIDPDKTRILKSYFSNSINSFVNFELAEGLSLSRAIGRVEYLKEDIRLVVNYGEYNRSYPGTLLKHDFVLDYDASVQGVYNISDIFPSKLIAAHEMIQNVFEHSITDKFRKIMKE